MKNIWQWRKKTKKEKKPMKTQKRTELNDKTVLNCQKLERKKKKIKRTFVFK